MGYPARVMMAKRRASRRAGRAWWCRQGATVKRWPEHERCYRWRLQHEWRNCSHRSLGLQTAGVCGSAARTATTRGSNARVPATVDSRILPAPPSAISSSASPSLSLRYAGRPSPGRPRSESATVRFIGVKYISIDAFANAEVLRE